MATGLTFGTPVAKRRARRGRTFGRVAPCASSPATNGLAAGSRRGAALPSHAARARIPCRSPRLRRWGEFQSPTPPRAWDRDSASPIRQPLRSTSPAKTSSPLRAPWSLRTAHRRRSSGPAPQAGPHRLTLRQPGTVAPLRRDRFGSPRLLFAVVPDSPRSRSRAYYEPFKSRRGSSVGSRAAFRQSAERTRSGAVETVRAASG